MTGILVTTLRIRGLPIVGFPTSSAQRFVNGTAAPKDCSRPSSDVTCTVSIVRLMPHDVLGDTARHR